METKETPAQFLTVQETARLLRTCPTTIRRWIRTGKLPARAIGLKRLVEREELERIISESVV